MTASRLLTKPNVSQRITELVEAQTKRIEFTADDVLRETKNLALTHMGAFIDDEGYVKGNLAELPESALACIQKLEQTTTIDRDGNTVITQKLALYDRLRALQVAGQHINVKAFAQAQGSGSSKPSEDFGQAMERIRRRSGEVRARGLCHACELPLGRGRKLNGREAKSLAPVASGFR